MSIVNSTPDVCRQVAILLKDPYFEPISWVGLFGSISRSTHSSTSDVDLILGYKENTTNICSVIGAISTTAEKMFGRPIELVHLIKQEVRAYLTLEALLTSVTVYGSDEWPNKLQELSRIYLDDGYQRFKETYWMLQEIQKLVAKTDVEVIFPQRIYSHCIVICIEFRRNYSVAGARNCTPSRFRSDPSF
jgi:predicted nucleotidyltransferase